MPEGPSIVILKELVQAFKGKKILEASGNSKKVDFERLTGQKVIDFKSFGKNFFICFKAYSIRLHFMLFGSYRINDPKDSPSRLALVFSGGSLNFYACVVEEIDESLDNRYDWSADVMSEQWNTKKAREKILGQPETMVCDLLLDQHIFAGVGNIIKNEVLYRIKVNPESVAAALPDRKVTQLIKEAVHYSFQFLEWKKAYTLKKHWLAHTRKTCRRCNLPLIKKHTGKSNRRSFYCTNCQELY